eukprot:2080801-Prymnesium_polylepis.1
MLTRHAKWSSFVKLLRSSFVKLLVVGRFPAVNVTTMPHSTGHMGPVTCTKWPPPPGNSGIGHFITFSWLSNE